MLQLPLIMVVAGVLAIALVVVYIRMAGKKAAARRDQQYYEEVEKLDAERKKGL